MDDHRHAALGDEGYDGDGALDDLLMQASGGGTAAVPVDRLLPDFACVVKVFSTLSLPSYKVFPNARVPAPQASGRRPATALSAEHQHFPTCMVLDQAARLILTCAHCVDYATFVEVRRHGAPTRFEAKVVFLGCSCDLALLTLPHAAKVDGDDFWETMPDIKVEFSGIPFLQDQVHVVGYPTGGDQLSLTAGVVSRVEKQDYSFGGENLLAVQIDAAINSGNSGGPAFLGRTLVGIAFQSLQEADNIGYIIPTPIINHFMGNFHHQFNQACKSQAIALEDGNGGNAEGKVGPAFGKAFLDTITSAMYHSAFTDLGVKHQATPLCQSHVVCLDILCHYLDLAFPHGYGAQECVNKNLRKFLGMQSHQHGVVLCSVGEISAAKGLLQPFDVLTCVTPPKGDPVPVADDGTIELWRGLRVDWSHEIDIIPQGEPFTVTVIRKGEEHVIKTKGARTEPLVPYDFAGKRLPYVVSAGLVFTPLSNMYWMPSSKREYLNSGYIDLGCSLSPPSLE
eukprot:gene3438-652_t